MGICSHNIIFCYVICDTSVWHSVILPAPLAPRLGHDSCRVYAPLAMSCILYNFTSEQPMSSTLAK